jgi:hypothetical protein
MDPLLTHYWGSLGPEKGPFLGIHGCSDHLGTAAPWDLQTGVSTGCAPSIEQLRHPG